jgi:uncharacterized membrane protein YgdD (TMEM256/DUF423 family)
MGILLFSGDMFALFLSAMMPDPYFYFFSAPAAARPAPLVV